MGFLAGFHRYFCENSETCVRRSDFIKSASSHKIYYRFFPEQLFLVLEELEGKKGDWRDPWLRKAGRKQWVLEEQGIKMKFWEVGKKRKLEDMYVQITFLDVDEGTQFCYGFILSYRGQLHTQLVEALHLPGRSEFSSAMQSSQNNILSCQTSMTVPNSLLAS